MTTLSPPQVIANHKDDQYHQSHLDLAFAIVHHAVLRSHGGVGVQRGGVKGHLLHFGDATDNVGLCGAGRLIFVLPVNEELLEERRLRSSRKDLDLCVTRQSQDQQGLLQRFTVEQRSSGFYRRLGGIAFVFDELLAC